MSEKNEQNNLLHTTEESVFENTASNAKREFFEWIEWPVFAIVLLVLCFSFLFRIATISGPSMENTLHNGERVIVSNLLYEPNVGDIVIVSRNKNNDVYEKDPNKTPIVKRIIATEGQTVDIDFEKGTVTVDGVKLNETYTKTPTNLKYDIQFPVIVDEGCVFVMGDNRNDSIDSRDSSIGMVDTRYILGKVVYRIFPFDKFGGLE